jgi:hypothetical protein
MVVADLVPCRSAALGVESVRHTPHTLAPPSLIKTVRQSGPVTVSYDRSRSSRLNRELSEAPARPPISRDLVEDEHRATALYYLTPHVFACLTRGGAVLLNLKRNKYYGLCKTDGIYLASIVFNWPTREVGDPTNQSDVPDESGKRRLVQALLDGNILQQSPPYRCDIDCSATSLDGALASIGDEIVEKASVRPTHLATFLFSLLSAAFCLRFLSLHFTVRFVSRRRTRAISTGYTFDSDRVAELIFIFRRLRPYFFVADGHCLLHALTLVNFLSVHREFPCWVMGVKTDPWGAHSWVQHGSYLLDTNPEKVCSYEPILSV